MTLADRAFVVAGGLAGCLGVGLAAAAAHVSGPGSLDVAARFLMIHAPALLALPALDGSGAAPPGPLRLAGFLLGLGLLLFCGDLALRALAGLSVLPMAAPVGGMLLIAGWALVGASALWPRRT